MTRSLASMIPADLDMTTSQRLTLVADIIEAHPEAHEQSRWVSRPSAGADTYFPAVSPGDITDKRSVECGTAFCAAGWAISLTPQDGLDEHGQWDWHTAGRQALGLAGGWTASRLFHAYNKRGPLVEALRFLAGLPETERTQEALEEAGFTADYMTGVTHTRGS